MEYFSATFFSSLQNIAQFFNKLSSRRKKENVEEMRCTLYKDMCAFILDSKWELYKKK